MTGRRNHLVPLLQHRCQVWGRTDVSAHLFPHWPPDTAAAPGSGGRTLGSVEGAGEEQEASLYAWRSGQRLFPAPAWALTA